MRPLVFVGLVLIVLGLVALAVPGFTYFTTERVAGAGPFQIDVSRPHTIFVNPVAGLAALAGGALLVLVGRRSAPS